MNPIVFYSRKLILVYIEAKEEEIIFSITGEKESGSITLKQNEQRKSNEQKTIIEVDEPTALSVGLKYLNLFAKVSSLDSPVTLRFSEDTPLLVEYKIDEKGKLWFLKYYLAPKVDAKQPKQAKPCHII